MQTFVPSKTFKRCAAVLDDRRLGKQRVECMQILNTLMHGGGWENHPAVNMWRGYEEALSQYMRAIILEWVTRGYENNIIIPQEVKNYKMPPWWGGSIHKTHRQALLAKDYHYYSRFWWNLEPNLNYFWPV